MENCKYGNKEEKRGWVKNSKQYIKRFGNSNIRVNGKLE